MNDALENARRLRLRGLSVIPVFPPDNQHSGKTAAIAWREFQTRLPTSWEIDRWFGGPQMNVAVITGALSGVVVVDADSPEAMLWSVRFLPYTPWQTKTARGWHLWYRHSGVGVRNRAHLLTRQGRLPIDVRGDGGYVIAPGSQHWSGVQYRYAGDWTRRQDELPMFQIDWTEDFKHPERAPKHPCTRRDVLSRARAYLARIPPPEIGFRSDAATMYAACRLVRGFGLGTADAEALIWEWAGRKPGFTLDWVQRKVRNAQRYGTEPVGGLVV